MTLQTHYTRAAQALKNLGLDNPFTLDQLSVPDGVNLDKATLVITPAITDEFTLYDLIKRFDQFNGIDSYIWEQLWDKYNQEIRQEAKASFILQEASDDPDSSHLYYRGKDLKKQRELLTKNHQTAMNPIEYVILQTISNAETGSLVDDRTWCRMAGLKNHTVDGDSCVAHVDSYGGRAGFGGSHGGADDRGGVGFSAWVEIRPLGFASASASAFDGATELKKLMDEAYQKGYADGAESVREAARSALGGEL